MSYIGYLRGETLSSEDLNKYSPWRKSSVSRISKKGMTSEQLVIEVDSVTLTKFKRRARKLGFKTAQDYLGDLVRRSAYIEAGRPRSSAVVDSFVSKFAKPTKETYKIIRSLRGRT